MAPRAASGAGGQTVVSGTVQQPQDAAVKSSQQVIILHFTIKNLKLKSISITVEFF